MLKSAKKIQILFKKNEFKKNLHKNGKKVNITNKNKFLMKKKSY